MHETIETRLARLEEAVVAVKGDTRYLRQSLDGFQHKYWQELVKSSSRIAGLSVLVSFVVATMTAVITHTVFK